MVFYEVSCVLGDPELRAPYLAWLHGHVAEVCAAGASSGTILLSDEAPLTVRVLYMFPSREALALYERAEAPRLREAGLRELARLGGEGRVVFARVRGEAHAVTA